MLTVAHNNSILFW